MKISNIKKLSNKEYEVLLTPTWFERNILFRKQKYKKYFVNKKYTYLAQKSFELVFTHDGEILPYYHKITKAINNHIFLNETT